MVSSISGTSSYQYQPRVDSNKSLTDDQKTTLEGILSKYDPETTTGETMKAMMDEIKEAGITPSKDFKKIMDDAGFKPPEKPSGTPPDETQSTDSDISKQLLSLLKGLVSGETSDDDINSLIKSIKSSSNSTVGTLVNQKV